MVQLHDQGQSALQVLLRMAQPQKPTGDPFLAKRTAQIYSGEDQLAPSELEQRQVQMQMPNMGVSREMVRDHGISGLKKTLGMQAAKFEQERALKTDAERVRGEYDLQGRRISNEGQMNVAKTYADQRAMSAEAAAEAKQSALDALLGRAAEDPTRSVSASGIGSVGAQRAPAKTGPSASVLGTIARERAALAKAVSEAEPGAIMGMLGRTNPRKAELENFDNTLGYAQKIIREFPGMSAEEALQALGQQPSPDELGQIQKFMLLLGGQ